MAIEGTVTLDGQPLEKGHIGFRPAGGTPGPTAGGQIVDGRFRIEREGGTFTGKFRVEITASRPSGEKMVEEFTGELVDVYKQFIPAQYNSQSEIEVEVQAAGPNHFAFALTSE